MSNRVAPAESKETKMIIIHKKGTRETVKITDPSVYFPTCTNCSRGHYKTKRKKVVDENQPREQAGSRTGYSRDNHLQATNQLIENVMNSVYPNCIGYIGSEKII